MHKCHKIVTHKKIILRRKSKHLPFKKIVLPQLLGTSINIDNLKDNYMNIYVCECVLYIFVDSPSTTRDSHSQYCPTTLSQVSSIELYLLLVDMSTLCKFCHSTQPDPHHSTQLPHFSIFHLPRHITGSLGTNSPLRI